MCVRARACMRVCVRERERHTHTHTQRQRETQRATETDKERATERERERDRDRDRDREKQRAMGVSSWVVGRSGESSRMWTVAAGPVRTFSVGEDVLEAVVGLVQLLPQLVLLLQHLGQHLQHTPAMCLTPTHQQRV